jgi:murein DD-endopeptidase MepM/ murein hydrolase activator NlpD
MIRNWVKSSAIAGLLLVTNCAWYASEDLVFDEPATVTVASYQEIKEQAPLDEYGIKVRLLVKEDQVKRDESLYLILKKFDVSNQIIYNIEQASKGIYRSNRLQRGQRYLVYKDAATNTVNRLILHVDAVNYVVFDWADKVWVERRTKEITKQIAETSGIITSSLYQSLKDNGDNPLLGSKLSEIFGWQIDFFSLQKEDSYKIIYEQEFVDGKPYGVGEIVAAKFYHKNRTYDAFHFETEERAGYFNRNGEGLQKALLKAPFTYSQRVSSGFSHNRFHPVLKKPMPHYGVDYAAPLGTPVIAVGDGEIIESRYRGANGNIVKIKHNSTYTTAYLHLNGFAPGIRSGVRVKQGQIIGYVGRTGRVTGVHLDYRIYKNGQPVNPLNVDLPPSKALTGEELERFKLYIERYRFILSQMDDELLALSQI